VNLTDLDLDTNPFDLPGRVVDAVRDSDVTHSLWPVAAGAGRAVLYVTAYGIRIYDGAANSLVEWSDMYELRAGSDGLSFRTGSAKVLREFTYLDNAHAAEVQAAVHLAGGNVPPVQHVLTEAGLAPLALEPRLDPGPRVTDPSTDPGRAKGILLGLFWGGIVAGLICGAIALAAAPGTDVSEQTGEVVHNGSRAVEIAASILGTVGAGMVFVALVGWAVMLGVRAARDS
jgi:hypothetical protein